MTETSPMDPRKILIVDDESRLLEALRRNLGRAFHIVVADSGAKGLEALREQGPFAVVVSDCMMPGMNGIEFLKEVARVEPDAVRIMLTGNADQDTAKEAVNQSQVFRFISKPCTRGDLTDALQAALRHHAVLTAERSLLENTLKGALDVLTEVLALANPQAFGRAQRIEGLVRDLCRHQGLRDTWRFEAAALLSQIGWVALPPDMLDRMATGQPLSEKQRNILDENPTFTASLLARIPRLEEVSAMIAKHRDPCEELEAVDDPVVRSGASMLAVATAFDEYCSLGSSPSDALRAMRSDQGAFDENLIEILSGLVGDQESAQVVKVPIHRLVVGMIIESDIANDQGAFVLTRGHRITSSTLERLHNHMQFGGLPEVVTVRVHADRDDIESAA